LCCPRLLKKRGSCCEHEVKVRKMNPQLLQNLKSLFNPKTVAVIGASENPDKLGSHVMKSLMSGNFGGTVLPVNPGSESIRGLKAFPSILDYPAPVELAIIVLPAKFVAGLFEECIKKNVKGIVLITAGFKEIDDPAGALLQESVARLANSANIPVIGPNTFGMINLHHHLNASFTPEFSWLQKGGISFISQSGGMSHLMAFMAMREYAGMSKIVGLGNRLNVDFAEMVAYLMDDADTRVIALYLEGLDEPRRLMEVAGKKRGVKPIIAYKTGRARSGDRASLSHTGSMAGNHAIYKGAMKQAGIAYADSAESLLDMARALAMCPLPGGNRVAILSGQAGPGMSACDVCESEGMKITTFGPATQTRINDLLPPLALRTNPVDMGPAWYNSAAIAGIVKAVMEDEFVDGILLLMMFASANREAVSGVSDFLIQCQQKKPVVACFMAPPGIWDDRVLELEKKGGLINVSTPERAARAMAGLWKYKTMIEEVSCGSKK
jgi:acetyl-CoA synthetase (ADP-forming)